MRRTSRLVLLAGVFLAAITFIVIVLLIGPGIGGQQIGGGVQPTPALTRTIVLAAVDIPLGTVITQDMVTNQKDVPLANALPGAFQDASQAIGKTTTQPLKAGAQVTADAFSFSVVNLAVPTGKRAFALKVNELTGVGNLVKTGDYVDVIISQLVSVVQKNPDGTFSQVQGLGSVLTVKMVLQEIQVIGTIDEVAAAAQPAPAATSGPPQLTGAGKLVILAVTPAQAEVLTFSRDTNMPAGVSTPGTVFTQVDLVLRSPEDAGQTVATDGVILKTLIDKYGVLPPNVVLANLP